MLSALGPLLLEEEAASELEVCVVELVLRDGASGCEVVEVLVVELG